MLIALALAAVPCPPPQIIDRSAGTAVALLAGPLAALAAPTTAGPERTAYVRTLVAGLPVAACPDEAQVVFDGSVSGVRQRWGTRWISERIPATLWPYHRERLEQVHGRWVDVTPVPTRAEIEARWLAGYAAAVGRIEGRR